MALPPSSATTDIIQTLQHIVVPVLTRLVPFLNVAKAGVTGIGIVGVEIGVSAAFELAKMVLTMKDNKEGLAALKIQVDKVAALKVTGAKGDLETRLTELSSQVKIPKICCIQAHHRASRKMNTRSKECKALIDKPRFDRYLRSDEYSKKILDIRNGIAEDIHEFTFHSNISIEMLVQDMAQTVGSIDGKADQMLAGNRLINQKVNRVDGQVDQVLASSSHIARNIERV
ncbi:hypothetical protein B0H11DRAFT_2208060, partial [Mycena galericulata]